MNCATINKLDLVNILDSIGYKPQQIKSYDYWYRSPFRIESKASFKIDRRRNYFYDFGEGTGGTPVDFLIKYYQCTVSELIQRFTNNSFSFPKQTVVIDKAKTTDPKIKVIDTFKIKSYPLINYLQNRGLSSFGVSPYSWGFNN